MLHMPLNAYSEYDPVELIVNYAALPSPQPSPSSSFVAPLLSSFLPEDDSDDESECWPSEEKLRSRSSCSTVATLATRAAAAFTIREAALPPRLCRALAGLGPSVTSRCPRRTHAPRASRAPIPALTARALVRVCARTRAVRKQMRRAVRGANRSRSRFSYGRSTGGYLFMTTTIFHHPRE